MESNSSFPLTHEHNPIESDGYIVCCECGLVCDENIFIDCNLVNEKINLSTTKFEIFEELKSKNVINEQMVNYCEHYVTKWKNEKLPLRKYHIPYSIYLSSKQLGYPISLKEIGYFTQCDVKDICKVEKLIKNSIIVKNADYTEKYCSLLNLTYMDEKIVKSTLSNVKNREIYNPNHLTAAVISYVFPSIPKKEIAEITSTSRSTIRKLVKEIKKSSNNL